MIKKHMLSNGLTIVMEHIPHAQSVSMGLWIKAGTQDEEQSIDGIAHMIEHMLFRGTKRFSAQELAVLMDQVGGEINAFTTKENTTIYAKALAKHWKRPLLLISDMMKEPLFAPEDLEKEIRVVVEEIKLYEDSPEELNYEILSEKVYQGTPLEKPITGTMSSVRSITTKELWSFFRRYYVPNNMVLSLAGNFDGDQVLAFVEEEFGSLTGHLEKGKELRTYGFSPGTTHRKKDLEQVHIELLFKGSTMEDPLYFPLHVLDNVLAGSLSSRLYQSLREDHGYVYAIQSGLSSYEELGDFSITLSLSEKYIEKALLLIRETLDDIKDHGIKEEELENAKMNLEANYLMSLESSETHMDVNGRKTLFEKSIEAPDEIVNKIRALTMEDIKAGIDYFFQEDVLGIGVIGPVEHRVLERIKTIMKWRYHHAH